MRLRSRSDDRGSITPFVVIVAIALLFLGALVIDGSRQLSARARAVAYAEEAARAAAQKIDLTKGWVRVLRPDAEAAIDEYCATAQANDPGLNSCVVTGFVESTRAGQIASVTVEVEVVYDPIMLGMIPGFSSSYAVSGEATAHPVEGIVEPEFDSFVAPSPIVDTEPVDPGIPRGTDVETESTVPSPEPPETCRPPGEPPPPKKPCKPPKTPPSESTTPPESDPPGDGDPRPRG